MGLDGSVKGQWVVVKSHQGSCDLSLWKLEIIVVAQSP